MKNLPSAFIQHLSASGLILASQNHTGAENKELEDVKVDSHQDEASLNNIRKTRDEWAGLPWKKPSAHPNASKPTNKRAYLVEVEHQV